jgi:spore germination cell wall hydrolase CwlJ-like protein
MIRLFTAALAALVFMSTSAAAEDITTPLNITGIVDLSYAGSDGPLTGATAEEITPLFLAENLPSADIRPRARPENFLHAQELAQLPRSLKDASELMCLAVTIYHEARGESLKGQRAVASVVLQRVAVPGRWGDTICEVTVPVQFSYLNDDLSFAPIIEYEAWIKALDVATVAMVEGPDPWLEGADHYHTEEANPRWNKSMPVVTRIGFHIFYADPISKAVMG